MFGIDDIIHAILAMAKGAAPLAVKQVQRQELVIKLLKKFKFDPEHPPADFTEVYRYTVVEYGGNQLGILSEQDLRLVLKLFRQSEIKQAFREAFDGDNPKILVDRVTEYIEGYALGDDIRDRRINLLPELAKFSNIFIEVVKRTRNPAEVRRDQKIDNVLQNQENLQEVIFQVLKQMETFDSIPAVLQKLVNLMPSDRPTLSKSVFSQQLHDWFEVLYHFESDDIWEKDYFEWIVQVRSWLGKYDRILVRGIEGEAKLNHLNDLRQSVEQHKTDQGLLVARSWVSQTVLEAVEDNRQLFCYTFDELIDKDADFSGYLDWLEAEVKSQKIDTLYVDLACTKEDIDPNTQQSLGKSRYDQENGWIDRYINTWLKDPAKEHLSILGEFGTGKTWFALHYAWEAVQKYRAAKKEGNELPRLPLVIPLRDYAKAVSVESLFSEFFFRQHNVNGLNYKAFEQLNRMGKLLLIFDGFDEMAAKIDRQKMINNFWELAKIVGPGAKAILTCRTEHFPEAKEGREVLNAQLQASTSNLSGEPPQFEVLELEKLNNQQIREVLSKRKAKPETIAKIMANSELVDLARRPVMINLILEALPEIESGKPIDLARIYLYAVSRKMERDIKTERTFTSMKDKLYFLCELAWEILSTDQISLNYRLFPDRIRRCFGAVVQEQTDLDHWHYDMMGQTLLIRNADGDYSPAHRSLLEFFVAYKFAVQLGILAPDFAEIATISFEDNLRDTFGKAPLTKAVLDLLRLMLNPETSQLPLLDLIVSTKSKTEEEVGYLGGNAATLLLKVDPYAIEGRDLSHTAILGADFTRASLRNVNLANANLSMSVFAKTFGSVLSVAFSPDGRFLATGHANGEIRLWQIADRKQLSIYRGHFNQVRTIAYSPDGKTLASGSHDHTIKLWNIQTGKCLHTFEGHSNWVRSVVYSPDGKTLASGSHDHTIKLWDIQTRTCVHTFEGHSNWVRSVAYSPNGKTLASGSYDRTIKLWDIQTGNCLHTFEGHCDWVRSVAYSPDGQTLASGSNDQTIKLWNIHHGQCVYTFKGHRDLVRTIAYSPDGNYLASGSHDQTIKLWNIHHGKCLHTFEGHGSSVRSIAYSPDGKTLASGSHDQTIKLWNIQTGNCLHTFEGHRDSVRSIAYSPNWKTLASGSNDKTIKLWNIDHGKCLHTFEGHRDSVRSIAYSPDGKTLASGSNDQTIKLWDIQTRKYLHTFEGHCDSVRSIAYSPDGKTLAFGSNDQTIKLWDIQTRKCLHTFEGLGSWVRSVAYSPDGQTIAFGSWDRTIKLWNIQTGNCLNIFEGHRDWVISVAYSPNSQTLASGSNDKTIKLWDIHRKNCLHTFEGHDDWVRSVAYSPNGQSLASGSSDQTIKIWDIQTGNCLNTFEGHRSWIRSVAYSPNGQTLASGSSDGTIKIWDLESGACVKTVSHQRCAGANIVGATGLTSVQKALLIALGAVE